jgi:hypothetical protein
MTQKTLLSRLKTPFICVCVCACFYDRHIRSQFTSHIGNPPRSDPFPKQQFSKADQMSCPNYFLKHF